MSNQPFNFQPVIIVGAARSGTNMLRNLLTQFAGVETWPCDEINYIWRYGNANYPTDELRLQHAQVHNSKAIRKKFAQQASKTAARWLVEKTCANSLRIDYVNKIIPEAKYLFLVRDGVDVVASAMKRWHAPLDIGYIAQKAAYIPWRDIPYYGFRYFFQRLRRLAHAQRQLPTWGPRFSGMQQALQEHSLAKVCALQWEHSVVQSSQVLSTFPDEKVCFIKYEQFTKTPISHLQRVLDFLQVPATNDIVKNVISYG